MSEAEERLGPYRLLSLLGEGGMARIYRARHEKLERDCAVKRLHAEHLDDPVTVARFLAEARAVGDLRHRNLVTVYDVVEAPGEIYLVMEYLDGEDVANVLRQHGQLSPQRAANLAAQVCDGLAVVHARGIVHRDLKPENIFIARDEQGAEVVKLLDFGVARLAERRPKELRTRTGLTVGTPTYMSPEQATASAIDARSDLYAVGILLYEMLSGRPPFTGGYGEVMLKHVHEAPPPLAARRPDAPPWLAAIAMRCLEKAPGRRIQTATELAAALRSGLAVARPTPAGRQRWITILAASVSVGALTGLLGLGLLRSGEGTRRAGPAVEPAPTPAAPADAAPTARPTASPPAAAAVPPRVGTTTGGPNRIAPSTASTPTAKVTPPRPARPDGRAAALHQRLPATPRAGGKAPGRAPAPKRGRDATIDPFR